MKNTAIKAIFKVLLQFSRKRNKTLFLLVVLAIIAFNHSTIVRWMVVTSSGVSNAIIESYDRSERHKVGYKVAEKVRRVCNNFLVNAALPYPPPFLAAPINNQGPMPYSLLLPQKQESVRSLPNPRLVSETLFKRVKFIPNEEGLSALLAFFANFVIESLFDTQSGGPGIIVFNNTQIPYAKPTGYNLATPRIDLGPIYARSDKLRSFKNGKMLMQSITVKGIAQDFPPYLNTIRTQPLWTESP